MYIFADDKDISKGERAEAAEVRAVVADLLETANGVFDCGKLSWFKH
jgi:hypothetical protein